MGKPKPENQEPEEVDNHDLPTEPGMPVRPPVSPQSLPGSGTQQPLVLSSPDWQRDRGGQPLPPQASSSPHYPSYDATQQASSPAYGGGGGQQQQYVVPQPPNGSPQYTPPQYTEPQYTPPQYGYQAYQPPVYQYAPPSAQPPTYQYSPPPAQPPAYQGAPEPRSRGRRSGRSLLPGFVKLFFALLQIMLLVSAGLQIVRTSDTIEWVRIVNGLSAGFVWPIQQILQNVKFPFPMGAIGFTLLAIPIYWLLSRLVVGFLRAVL